MEPASSWTRVRCVSAVPRQELQSFPFVVREEKLLHSGDWQPGEEVDSHPKPSSLLFLLLLKSLVRLWSSSCGLVG